MKRDSFIAQQVAALRRRTGSGSSGVTELTGDITAGPGSGSQAASIANDAVTNAKLANMAADTIKGRADGAGTGDPQDLTANQVSTILDTATDPFLRTSAAAAGYTDEQAQDAVGGMVDSTLVYTDATPLLSRAALTGDVTAAAGSNATTIANDAVTYAKMQDVAANSYLGRAASSSGDVSAVAIAASQLAGRGSSGDLAAIGLGSGLSMSGTTLSVTSVPGGGGGGLVLIEQHTASNSATLDFTSWYSSTYDEYVIEIIGIIPATDATLFEMKVSTDGGANWSATSYRYALWGVGSHAGTGTTASNGAAVIVVGGTVENTTSVGFFHGSIKVFNPGSTTRVKGFQIDCVFRANDNNHYRQSGVGAWADVTAIDGIQFLFNSGNIAEGTIRIYGIAKS